MLLFALTLIRNPLIFDNCVRSVRQWSEHPMLNYTATLSKTISTVAD